MNRERRRAKTPTPTTLWITAFQNAHFPPMGSLVITLNAAGIPMIGTHASHLSCFFMSEQLQVAAIVLLRGLLLALVQNPIKLLLSLNWISS